MSKDTQLQVRNLLQDAAQLQQQGVFGEAILLASQACDLARRELGEEHVLYAQCLDNLAKLYETKGDYRQAEPLYRESLQISRSKFGNVNPEIARKANNLAELYRKIGAFTEARPLYEEALGVLNAIGEGEGIDAATVQQNLALVHAGMYNYPEAASLLEEALAQTIALLGEEDPEVAIIKDNLGNIYASMGKYKRAEQLCLQALDVLSKFGEQSDVAICLANLASIYEDMGKAEQAIPRYQQAMEINLQLFGKDHPQYAASASLLGSLYLRLGQYGNAEPLLRQALATRRQTLGEAHSEVGESLQMVAFLCAVTSREEEALQLLEQRATIDERLLDTNFYGGSVSQRLEYLEILQDRTHIFLSFVLKFLPVVPTAAQRGLAFLLRRKGLSMNAWAIPKDLTSARDHEELFTKIEALLDLRAKLYRSIVAGPQQESLDDYRYRLEEYSADLERLEADITRLRPSTSLSEQLQAINLQGVAEALPVDSALIEFVCVPLADFGARGEFIKGPLHYLAFVLPVAASDQVRLFDLGEAKTIDELIATYRLSVTGGDRSIGPFMDNQPTSGKRKKSKKVKELRNSTRNLGIRTLTPESLLRAGKTLRKTIFDPLNLALGNYKRLILSPDSELFRLPFEILPLDDGRYLLEEYQVSYVTAGRDLLEFGRVTRGQLASSIIVGDPDFDLGGVATEELPGLASQIPLPPQDLIPRLPGTLREGQRIAGLLGVTPLLGAEALTTKLKSCHSPLVLHIATHGYFIPDFYPMSSIDTYPSHVYLDDIRDLPQGRYNWFWGQLLHTSPSPFLRAGLLLAGFNTWLRGGDPPVEAEEGVLTAAEVLNMDLQETQLVVLSACDTGVGQALNYEGVFGLRRAFMLAGVKTLVMSLWNVYDQQTQELMIDFYKRLLAGHSPADALRAAQIALKAAYPHPIYWGAFIYQGDSTYSLSY